MVETDFAVGNAKLFTQRQDFSDVNAGVKPEFIEYISGQAGIEDSGACYFSYGSQILNDDFQNRYDEYFNENYIHQANEVYRKVLELSIRDTKENGYTLALNLYGHDKFPMSYLKIVEGTLDIEKLETGNYAVISKDTVNPNSSFYHVGDKITCIVDYEGNPQEEEFEVLAIVEDLPVGLSTQQTGLSCSSTTAYISSQQFKEKSQFHCAMSMW